MVGLRKIKYKKVKNFLTEDEVKLLKGYCTIRSRLRNNNFQEEKRHENCFYGDPIMESLMVSKGPKVEKLTGLKLLPTYSYWRMYIYGSELKPHKDRPSCEVSVTVCIDKDKKDWPIYMDDSEINLNPGDAVIYLGREVKHWRNELKGDFQSQVFLHYVDQNGEFTEHYKDKSTILGMR